MSLYSQRFLNESEGGAPEKSPYGNTVRKGKLNIFPKILTLWHNPSGVHGTANNLFGGYFGRVARGGIPPSPVFSEEMNFYQGELPMSQQPRLIKPYPWE